MSTELRSHPFAVAGEGTTGELRTWEDVLAAVEADVERTTELLSPSAPSEASVLVLPPLPAMPSVPAHLQERIRALRDRIDALQAELAATLREWEAPVLPARVASPAAPRFLDRRV